MLRPPPTETGVRPGDAPPPTTNAAAAARPGAAGAKGVLMPVAIVLAIGAIFVSVYLAAFHAPRPHHLPVAAVGPAQGIERITSRLDADFPGQFTVKTYRDESAARHALEHREVYAAYLAPDPSGGQARLLYSGANGPSVTATLTGSFGRAAGEDGQRLVPQDALPSSAGDTRGLSIFYAAFGLVLAGFLFGTMTYQMAPRLSFRQRMTSLAAFGVAGGIAIALIASTGFDALPGPFLGVAGVTALMAIAVGGATMVFMRLLGPAGLSLASVVLLTLGNSTSGGILPSHYLPAWLRPLSEILPVGVGVRALQGLAYFRHDGLVLGVTVLALWIAGCVAVLYVRDVRRPRARQAASA